MTPQVSGSLGIPGRFNEAQTLKICESFQEILPVNSLRFYAAPSCSIPMISIMKENGSADLWVNENCVKTERSGHVKNLDSLILYSSAVVKTEKTFHTRKPLHDEFIMRFLFDMDSTTLLLARKLVADLDKCHDFYMGGIDVLTQVGLIKSHEKHLLKGLIKLGTEDNIEVVMPTIYRIPENTDDETIFNMYILFAVTLKKMGCPYAAKLHDYTNIDEFKKYANYLKERGCTDIKSLLFKGLEESLDKD
jgi:hypothetical protein